MSGKQSRKLRKMKGFSKKAVAGAAAAILCSAPLAAEGGEFLVSLYPHFSFPVIKFDETLSTGFGGGLRLTYRPTDYFGVFVQGDYKQFAFDTQQSIGSLSIFDGMVGAGYHLPITDRVGVDLDAGVGYYYSNYERGSGSDKSSVSLKGLNVGGSISISYKIGPSISVYASGGAQHYAYMNSKFVTSIDANPGVTFNLTKAFSNKNNVSLGEQTLKPVFPVFYSWYNDNPFGTIEVYNDEDASITDVTVSFYQQQYMGQPRECGKTAILKKGEKFVVDLKAFFNENMLNLNEKSDTMANIIVEYKYLGAKRSETFSMIVPVYGRNNMSWEDDRCASAFVSSKDPAAMWFAKYVTSIIREDVRSGVPQNIQYAMAVFQALDQFGINYVKDPTSAFEDNVGTASIDFLQFPYQTLMYRGGDCDDLSILTCSLFESIGIKTAFITIPGHIFMAFDSGLSIAEAKDYFDSLDNLIVYDNKVWVPLEITLSDEGFNKAWHKGAWEWNTAARTNDAMIYPMEASWKIYKPVSVPGAAAKFTLPSEVAVANSFSASIDEFVLNQITPQIAHFENLLVKAPTAQNYNDFGILYARYGLFEQAEEQFQMARNVQYLPSILNTANLCYSQKDYSKAIDWYKQVLAVDSTNNLAMLGLARCAYETGDYSECDRWYAIVYKNDRKLARQYSYLGAFESTSGRSFSLADRLENTVWLQSEDFEPAIVEPKIKQLEPKNNIVVATASNAVIKTKEPEQPASTIETQTPVVAVVPASTSEEEENKEEEIQATASGDGDDKQPVIPEAEIVATEIETAVAETQTTVSEPVEGAEEVAIAATESIAVAAATETAAIVPAATEIVTAVAETEIVAAEPAVNEIAAVTTEASTVADSVEIAAAEPVTTEPVTSELAAAEFDDFEDEDDEEEYVGISSELDFDFLTVMELAELAEEAIIENGETLDDFDTSMEIVSAKEDRLIDKTFVSSIMTDVPIKEPSVNDVAGSTTAVSDAEASGEALTDNNSLSETNDSAQQTVLYELNDVNSISEQNAVSEPVENTTPEVLNIEDYILDIRDVLPDLFEAEDTVFTFAKEEPKDNKKTTQTAAKKTESVEKTTETVAKTPAAVEKSETSDTDWVPELVEGLKELEKSVEETAQVSTAAEPAGTSTASETVVVPEPVEGPQEVATATPEATPTKKSKVPLYAGIAVIAGALAALVIAKRKKGKKDE